MPPPTPTPTPRMSSAINQSEIPTLPVLYHANKLTPNLKPLFSPDAAINAKIGLIRTDITKLHLPNGAIVNAANEGLTPGGGVCGAIHSAAGRELADECRMHRGCETGRAKMTRAYRLPCKRVIHAVGPIYWLTRPINSHAMLLESCYSEVLKLCVSDGLTSVAFCALSTGIYGYPSYEAAESALKAVRKFLETEKGKQIELVIFCNFEKKDEDAYLDLVSTYFPPAKQEDKAKEITGSAEPSAEPSTKIELAKTESQSEPTKPVPAAESSKDTTDGASDTKSQPSGHTPPDTEAKADKPKTAPKTEAAPAPSTEKPKPADADLDETDDFVLVEMEDAEHKPKK